MSMGWGAGKKLFEVIDNVRRVIAIEILCATQGLDYRKPLAPAPGTARVAELVRQVVPTLEVDRPLSAEIEAVSRLISDRTLTSLTP